MDCVVHGVDAVPTVISSDITLLFCLRQIKIFKVTAGCNTGSMGRDAIPGQFPSGGGEVPGNESTALSFLFFILCS